VLDDDRGVAVGKCAVARVDRGRVERVDEVALAGVEVDVRAGGVDRSQVVVPVDVDRVRDRRGHVRRRVADLAREPKGDAGGERRVHVVGRAFDAEVVGREVQRGERVAERVGHLRPELPEHTVRSSVGLKPLPKQGAGGGLAGCTLDLRRRAPVSGPLISGREQHRARDAATGGSREAGEV